VKITAVTKFKHGELYAMLQRVGWKQSDLARNSGLSENRIGEIINLQRRPIQKEADAIQRALGTVGEYLDVLSEWPETFVGLKRGYRREQTIDVPMERLLDHPEALQIAAPEYQDDEIEERVKSVISKLPERNRQILIKRFWENKKLEEISNEIGVGKQQVHNLEKRSIRMLMHPARARKLMPHWFEWLSIPYEKPEDQ
jgi:DNA-directed RNA polymerase sigma subunit (sigma70/sigma32)|tara:strand:- start:188 stop:784 length:597 start_codon:yes stop_codon:yes gene_type:complete